MIAALELTLVRFSAAFALTPFFSSRAFPARTKAALAFAVCLLLVPMVVNITATSTGHPVEVTFRGLLGEVAVGAVYGLTLSMFSEMLLLAGQIIGLQLSFSLVNLLDPQSEIQTPLMGDLFQVMGIWIMIAAGLDRTLLASIMRSLRAVPPGSFPLERIGQSARTLVPLLSGSFFAALELAAPVLAATVVVEVAVALLGKLSPQLPVISLTVPLKTLTGFGLLIGALSLWPRFIEARFDALLDVAERLIAPGFPGGRG